MTLYNKLFNQKSGINLKGNSLEINQNNPLHTVQVERSGFNLSNTKLSQSDVVKACINPVVNAIGKLDVVLMQNEEFLQDKELSFLMQEPNEIDTLQTLLEKLTTNLKLNNNAYALIVRDKKAKPIEIKPITPDSVEMVVSNQGNKLLKMRVGDKTITAPYDDVIHLRQNYNDKEYFGLTPSVAIQELIDTISTTDASVDLAIKDSTDFKFLLKFNSVLHEDDLESRTQSFMKRFKNSTVGASDNSYEVEQLKQQVYVPPHEVQREKIKRVYDYFGVNEAIVTSNYNENQWNAFYESKIEPIIKQLSNEFTRKLFTRVERMKGKRIILTATGLQYSNMETKLKLTEFLDRGIMTPNEVREILNLANIEGGDVPIRRLDTVPVTDPRHMKGGEDIDDNGEA